MVDRIKVLGGGQKMKQATALAKEVEEGNHEYKFKLANMSDAQINHRISQLQWRLNEGENVAIYHLGVEDDGNPLGLSDEEMQESLRTLQFMADQADCDMVVKQLFSGEQGITAEVTLRRRARPTLDTRMLNVALAGDVDSGKSTLIGVLCSGKLDNGKGLARTRVFTHNHEVETGRTSCISHTLLHFSQHGDILNADPSHGGTGGNQNYRLRALSDLELAERTQRSVSLIDLAGHAKYLKTTLHGMIGRKPDYCIICVSAVQGVTSITAEHLSLGMYLNVPLILVITKLDHVLNRGQLSALHAGTVTCESLCATVPALGTVWEGVQQLLRHSSRSALRPVTNAAELVDWMHSVSTSDTTVTVPVFLVSAVTGDGIGLVRTLLHQLPSPKAGRAPALSLLQPEPAKQDDCCDASTASSEQQQQQHAYIRILGAIGGGADTDNDDDDADNDEDDEDTHAHNNSNNNKNAKQSRYAQFLSSEKGRQRQQEQRTANINADADVDTNAEVTEEEQGGVDEEVQSLQLQMQQRAEDEYTSSLSEFSKFVDVLDPGASPALCEGAATSRVLLGKVVHGRLQLGEGLVLGPTSQGRFVPVAVTSIRLNNVPVRYASVGQTATFRLGRLPSPLSSSLPSPALPLTSSSAAPPLPPVTSATAAGGTPAVRRSGGSAGLVLLSAQLRPLACWEFCAELWVLNHPSRLRAGYEPVVHIGTVRQTVKVLEVRRLLPGERDTSMTRESSRQTTEQALREAELLADSAASGVSGVSGLEALQPPRRLKLQSADLLSPREILPLLVPAASDTQTQTQEAVESEVVDELCNGDRGIVRFRFLYYPEFVSLGEEMILREDRIRAMGMVTSVSCFAPQSGSAQQTQTQTQTQSWTPDTMS